ncbi:MAG TPA: glycosyltransferase family 2 protein [Gaiellaceae bacterium]|nr:glycosyltransferase family 2 protein [Gaiellaceae bacterium]
MSANDLEISVVIPCLNEESGIAEVVGWAWEGIERSGRTGEVLVVDNGSTDRSVERAERAGARVVHESRRGYGSAYLRGLEEARGHYIFMGDADGTYDFRDLEPFLEQLEAGKEFVLGSRYRGTIHEGAMPWMHRWIGNPILTRILNLFFGLKVSDAYCGMRAIDRTTAQRLGLQATGMEFALEMSLKAAKRNVPMGEVPIDYYARAGDSKLHTWRDGWRSLRFMLIHSATFLFLIPGLVILFLGLLILVPMSSGPITVFGVTLHIHTMIVASTATLVGAQIVQLGVFARTYAVLYMGDEDRLLQTLWKHVRLEHGLLLGGALALAGFGILLGIFVDWATNGFGALSREYLAILGLTLAGLGVQIAFASFFLSVLALPTEAGAAREAERARPQEAPVAVGQRAVD